MATDANIAVIGAEPAAHRFAAANPDVPKPQFPRLSPAADQSEFDIEFDTHGLQRVRYYPPGRTLPAIGPDDDLRPLAGGGHLLLSEAGEP